MSHQDFKSWDSISETYLKNNLVGKISKIKIVKLKKNDLSNIFVKFSMDNTAETEKIEVLGKNKRPADDLYKNHLPIHKQKHADLVKLLQSRVDIMRSTLVCKLAMPNKYYQILI
ncbi:unnamed protein product [Diatraea saccharalis]|uniref:Uncharacterized protein n=1 Tax=Diatraea saccharalis TaxID=40085 RepID=A0A9N9N059_9NEOP|nr:unnamed protein product [Diatraea saccharalis]